MKRTLKVISGVVSLVVGLVGCLLSLVVCCTVVLLPFGIMMFAGSCSVGAIGINLIVGKPLTKRGEKIAIIRIRETEIR